MEGMCLQLQIPTEKDKGNHRGEIPGPHFSCCSCGLKPLNLARLPREGLYKAHCPFPKSSPPPLLPEEMQHGREQVATAMVLRTFASYLPGIGTAAAADPGGREARHLTSLQLWGRQPFPCTRGAAGSLNSLRSGVIKWETCFSNKSNIDWTPIVCQALF